MVKLALSFLLTVFSMLLAGMVTLTINIFFETSQNFSFTDKVIMGCTWGAFTAMSWIFVWKSDISDDL